MCRRKRVFFDTGINTGTSTSTIPTRRPPAHRRCPPPLLAAPLSRRDQTTCTYANDILSVVPPPLPSALPRLCALPCRTTIDNYGRLSMPYGTVECRLHGRRRCRDGGGGHAGAMGSGGTVGRGDGHGGATRHGYPGSQHDPPAPLPSAVCQLCLPGLFASSACQLPQRCLPALLASAVCHRPYC